MNRKITAFLLTLIMLISTMSMTAPAAVIVHGPEVHIPKTVYAPGERIRATVSGITGGALSMYSLHVCEVGKPGVYISSLRLSLNIEREGSTFSIPAPDAIGSYEVWLQHSSYSSPRYKAAFTTSNSAPPIGSGMKMTSSRRRMDPANQVMVTVTGVTQAEENYKAAVHLCTPNQSHKESIRTQRVYVKGTGFYGDNTLWFSVPGVGNYELRLYSDGEFPSAASLVTKIPLEVTNESVSDMVLSLNKNSYNIGEDIIATVSGITQADVNTDAAVNLRKANTPGMEFITQKLITGTGTQTLTFTNNLDWGSYEAMLALDGATPDASSLVMRVQFSVGIRESSNKDPAQELYDRLKGMKFTKKYFTPGEWVTVDKVVSINPADLKSSGVGVFLCMAGQPHGEFVENINLNKLNGDVLSLSAPEMGGDYELRFYSNSLVPSAETLLEAIPFNVAEPFPDDIETPPDQDVDFTAIAIGSGVRLEWPEIPEALYYRVYRSATQGAEGISITDFAIDSTIYVDVNVDADTTYYYSMRPLLKEASVITGERETLGDPTAQISVKTGSEILGGNISDMGTITKNAILMKIDDPNMSVNGLVQEIDPGRGTSPQIIFGRTIVPIRAIIETMLGKIEWEDATQKITLNANDHSVIMWLNKKELVVDGQAQTMDVAPVSVNSRTMVPVRFAAENVGCVVDWIASTKEIVVVFYS